MKVPFKVRCVLEVNYDYIKETPCNSPISIGSEYTVVHQQQEPECMVYALEGFDQDDGFDARLFAILPDISADEMQEEVREAIVNLEPAIA